MALKALFHIQSQHGEKAAPYNFIKAAAGRTGQGRRMRVESIEKYCIIK